MLFFQGFLAFKANRRMHHHIQNAAVIAIFIAVLLQQVWPSADLASKSIVILALGLLLVKFYFQPAVICYIPSKYTSEYTGTTLRRDLHIFPRLYLAYTGNLLAIKENKQSR
jgi:hypothetical protein